MDFLFDERIFYFIKGLGMARCETFDVFLGLSSFEEEFEFEYSFSKIAPNMKLLLKFYGLISCDLVSKFLFL